MAVQKVDENPAVVKDSSAECMLNIIQTAKDKADAERESLAAAGRQTAAGMKTPSAAKLICCAILCLKSP